VREARQNKRYALVEGRATDPLHEKSSTFAANTAKGCCFLLTAACPHGEHAPPVAKLGDTARGQQAAAELSAAGQGASRGL